MKKRWLLTSLLVLILCAGAVSANAAVTSGGVEYLWYTQPGQQTWGNSQVAGFSGGELFLSADGGVSYAPFPEFQEFSRQGWTDYAVRVTALEPDGLRVEARSTFGEPGSPYTQRWDFSAAQLAALFATAELNPVTVLADNGTVAVGRRWVYDYRNDDMDLDPRVYTWRAHNMEGQLLWSADGNTWSLCQYPEGLDISYYMDAWWDSGRGLFCLREDKSDPNGYTSADGVHWTAVELLPVSSDLVLTADWGRYHFEVVKPKDDPNYWHDDPNNWYNEVYLMDANTRDVGVLLPHMGEGIRANGIGVNEFTAVAGSNDTVVLTVSNTAGAEYSLSYPISSLDWCLENLSVRFRDKTQPAALVSDGTVSLAKVAEHYRDNNAYRQEGELLRNDGSGWKSVETPFSRVFELLPYNGKTFMAVDTATGRQRLYASPDGLTWREVDTLRPEGMDQSTEFAYANYTFFWTGESYYVGMKAGERRHGIMGSGGGSWYSKNTQVWFMDENFQVLSSHDFGRLVERVGYADGAYYAEVVKNEGTSDHRASGYSTLNTIYRSTDGKNWTALPREYVELNALPEKSVDEYNDDIPDVLLAPVGGSRKGNLPTGDPAKPLRSVAQLDRWRFILYERSKGYFDVYLMRGNANDMARLNLEEEIKSRWITPGELSAAYTADGNVRLTVRDMSTSSMEYSATYTPQELDAMARGAGEDGSWWGNRSPSFWYGEEQMGAGTEVALLPLINGEKEVAYRNRGDWAYMYLENVPWSNSVRLLPFSGKDFMLLDLADGKLWRSADGRTWREAAGDFLRLSQGYDRAEYCLLWTGKNYLACCYLDNGQSGDEKRVSREVSKVFLLDEELNIVSSHDFGKGVERIGFRDGVCYADVSEKRWDERERYGTFHFSGEKESDHTLWRSADGVNWEKTDIVQVRECLRELGK